MTVEIDPLWPGAVAREKLALAKEQCDWPPPPKWEWFAYGDGWRPFHRYDPGWFYCFPRAPRSPFGVPDHQLAHQRGMRMR